jgi:SAM-dependent methyltransferase
MNQELTSDTWRSYITACILDSGFRRATFGGPVRGMAHSPWVRVVVRPLEIRGEPCLQFAYFDAKKDITKNYPLAECAAKLEEVLNVGFAAIHVSTATEELDIHRSKKGAVRIGRGKVVSSDKPDSSTHNRTKDTPLPLEKAGRLLQAMDLLTQGGQIKPTRHAKYRQINEFLKQFRHVLDQTDLRSAGRELTILDCGCGLSYLTLAVHHYLNDILHVPAHILGVDVNEEVIRKSMQRSACLVAPQLRFSCGPIDAVKAKPDIVLALHACDTATDDALAYAVTHQARMILSVPCCHHHLHEQMRTAGPAEILRPLLRHGILRQRALDLATDAFRAQALRIMGYRTEVVEFISSEHTARNLMIRAVHALPSGEPGPVQEYLEMKRFWGVTPYIERGLGERFQEYLR